MGNGNSRAIFILDLLIIYLSFFYLNFVYHGDTLVSPKALLLMGVIALSWFLICTNSSILKVYQRSNVIGILIELLIGYSVLTAIIILLVAVFGNFRPNDKVILYSLLISVIFSSTCRLIYILCIRRLTKNGFNQKSILLIGGGRVAERVMKRILSSPYIGYRLYGVIADNYRESIPRRFHLGGLDQFKKIVRTNKIDEVIIAKPLRNEKVILDLVDQCEQEGVRFHIVPDFFRIIRNRAVLTTLDDIPLIAIRTEPLNLLSNRLIKRTFDIFASILILVLLWPLLIYLAVAIKLSSKGPILFKQKRVGYNNIEFDIYKFRSMTVQVEKDSNTIWTTENDQRVSHIGEFMRKNNLDELPQLWNVLKSDMSLVGPRPERGFFVEQFRKEVSGYKVRHLAKSGISGWAQVNGWRGNTSITKRVEHDIWYIENWTFWLDIKILWLTVFGKETNRNAY